MGSFEDKIREFFSAYEHRFMMALQGKDDVEGTAAAFAGCFIEANPKGVSCGSNNEQFREMIPKGNAYYRQIGTKEMTVRNITCTLIDTSHYMAKVDWHSVYNKKDNTEVAIDFAVTYLLQDIDNKLQVFAYITGDEEGVLKENGII